MAPCLETIVPVLRRFIKQRAVFCPHCRFLGRCWKNGAYRRFRVHRRVRVQRYLCPNPQCKAVTFSRLPVGLMPVLHITLLRLAMLFDLVATVGSISDLARRLDWGRSTVRRRVAWGKRFFPWAMARQEAGAALIDATGDWGVFCILVSRAFFPGRMPSPEHQHTPVIP